MKEFWEKRLNIIAAVLFLGLAAYFIIIDVFQLNVLDKTHLEYFNSFIYLNRMLSALPVGVGYVLVAITLIMKKAKPVFSLGFIICMLVNAVTSILYQMVESQTSDAVGYIAVIRRCRATVPFNSYFGETVSLVCMIVLIFVIYFSHGTANKLLGRLWFLPGAIKALFVILEVSKTIKTYKYFNYGISDTLDYLRWSVYLFVMIGAYMLAGLWIAQNVRKAGDK